MYTLTDNISTEVYDLDDIIDLEDKLNAIFDRTAFAYEDEDGDEHTTGEVIDSLIAKHKRGEDATDEESCLNITIE